ncbi:alpha-ketoacid dehydrogenase kinase [Atractiella rhizophila]|nr:alpha-ketoacid dehydrogenase kinase [Atractiella rhizophila]
MAAFQLTSSLKRKITDFASFQQTPISLKQMVLFGKNPSPMTLLRAGQFLQEELPIRLAHRVKELDELPNNLSDMPSIKKVRNWYAQSFEELVEFPKPSLSPEIQKIFQKEESEPLPTTTPNPSLPDHLNSGYVKAGSRRPPLSRRYYASNGEHIDAPEVYDYNERLTKLLSNIKRRHDGVVTTIAQGILEYKKLHKDSYMATSIQQFLDRFYMSRIGIRVLIGQHIALNQLEPHDNYVGIICTKTNIYEQAKEAVDNASFICEEHYGLFKPPEVQLIGPRDLTFMYVPSHLNHMIFEITKNSLRAVVERFGAEAEAYPPIKLIIAEGNEDITIKISDEGGGIPRSAIDLVWTYLYSTADPGALDQDFGTDFKAPMAGFGYGLPIARLYSRYFGGDLQLISMEGYGTDVYLHLSKLSER